MTFEIDQIVTDKFGNVYTVVEIKAHGIMAQKVVPPFSQVYLTFEEVSEPGVWHAEEVK